MKYLIFFMNTTSLYIYVEAELPDNNIEVNDELVEQLEHRIEEALERDFAADKDEMDADTAEDMDVEELDDIIEEGVEHAI